MKSTLSILIAGAGIGGLATALALYRKGFQSHLYERTSIVREIGAGISLWPNATRILSQLGILEEALSMSHIMKRAFMKTQHGRILKDISLEQSDTPAICIHRADLHALLVRQLPPESLILGEELIGFEEINQHVALRFTSDLKVAGDCLIGADGIHSRVRAQLHGNISPLYRGYIIWRGIAHYTNAALEAGHIFEWWGAGKRFGMIAMGQGRTYWFCSATMPETHPIPLEGKKEEVLGLFTGWHQPIEEIIRATDEEHILRNPAYDRPPLHRWGSTHTTLLGDAAHPSTPNLGQGACLALEDAATLAECFGLYSDIPKALQHYERLRVKRTASIVQQSLLFGRVGQWAHPWLVSLRTVGAKLFPTWLFEQRMRPVHNYRVKVHV